MENLHRVCFDFYVCLANKDNFLNNCSDYTIVEDRTASAPARCFSESVVGGSYCTIKVRHTFTSTPLVDVSAFNRPSSGSRVLHALVNTLFL